MKPLTHSPHNSTIENTGPGCCPPAPWQTSQQRAGRGLRGTSSPGSFTCRSGTVPVGEDRRLGLQTPAQAQAMGYFLDLRTTEAEPGCAFTSSVIPASSSGPWEHPSSKVWGGALQTSHEWPSSMTERTTRGKARGKHSSSVPKKEGSPCTSLPLAPYLGPQISAIHTCNLLNKSFSAILNRNNWQYLKEHLQTQTFLSSNLLFLTCHTQTYSSTCILPWLSNK